MGNEYISSNHNMIACLVCSQYLPRNALEMSRTQDSN